MSSIMLRPVIRSLRVSQCAATLQRHLPLSTSLAHRCTSSSSSSSSNNNSSSSSSSSSSTSTPAKDAPKSRFRSASQYKRSYHTDSAPPTTQSSTALTKADSSQPLSFMQLQGMISALNHTNNNNDKRSTHQSLASALRSPPSFTDYPLDRYYTLPWPLLQQHMPDVLYDLCEVKPLPRGVLAEGEERELEVYDDRLPTIAPSAETVDEPLLLDTKRTYQPKVLQRKRKHGFLSRLRRKKGRQTLLRRLQKGRWRLSA